jgi:hypothetical protein
MECEQKQRRIGCSTDVSRVLGCCETMNGTRVLSETDDLETPGFDIIGRNKSSTLSYAPRSKIYK